MAAQPKVRGKILIEEPEKEKHTIRISKKAALYYRKKGIVMRHILATVLEAVAEKDLLKIK